MIIFGSVWFLYKLTKLKLLFLKFKSETSLNWLVLIWFGFFVQILVKPRSKIHFCCLGTCSGLYDWILFKIIGVANYNIIEKAIPYKIWRKIKTENQLRWEGKQICSYYMSWYSNDKWLLLNVYVAHNHFEEAIEQKAWM